MHIFSITPCIIPLLLFRSLVSYSFLNLNIVKLLKILFLPKMNSYFLLFFTASIKRVIYEYHRIEVKPSLIVSNTIVLLKAQPSRNNFYTSFLANFHTSFLANFLMYSQKVFHIPVFTFQHAYSIRAVKNVPMQP